MKIAPRRQVSGRVPVFQTLESRCLLAFGDVDLSFADNGRFEQSYAVENQTEMVRGLYDLEEDNQLIVESIAGGSGPGIGFRKLDEHGDLINSFGDGGIVNWFDSDFASTGISSFRLAGGNILTEMSSPYTRSYASFDVHGQLDHNFAEDGLLRLGPELQLHYWESRPHPDGGFIVVGQRNLTTVVLKFTASGVLDPSFGTDGEVAFEAVFQPQLHVDAPGGVLVYGHRFNDGYKATFVRLNSDGSLDTTFGPDATRSGDDGMSLSRMLLTPDANAYFILQRFDGTEEREYRLFKFTTDFLPDSTFGVDGILSFTTPAGWYSGDTRVLVNSDHSLYLQETWNELGRQSRVVLASVTAAGTLNASFGMQGVSEHWIPYETNVVSEFFQDSDGSLYWTASFEPDVGKNWKSDSLVLKFDLTGQVDVSWSESGMMMMDRTIASRDVQTARLLAHRGSDMSVAVGWRGYESEAWGTGQMTTLDVNGSTIDSGRLGLPFEEVRPSVVLANDGGWYSSVRGYDSMTQSHSVELRRYRSDGSPVEEFGDSGLLRIPTDRMQDIFLRADRQGGIVLVAGNYEEIADPATSLGVAVVVRLTADGQLDTNFADDGILRIFEKPNTILDVMVSLDLGIVLAYRGTVLQLLDWQGLTVSSFGGNGNGYAEPLELRPEWVQGRIDEQGSIVGMLRQYYSNGLQSYILVKIDAQGNVLEDFGGDGTVEVPIEWNPVYDSPKLDLRSGVIVTLNAQADGTTRLNAFDYSGVPLTELGPQGYRDYDFAPNGETISDLKFADDGSIWVAMIERTGFDEVAAVYRLEGSTFGQLHNWSIAYDVNRDEFISPLDALIIINRLNGSPPRPEHRPDTNRDDVVSAIDALLVINYLNSSGGGEQGGEGEFTLYSPVEFEGMGVDWWFDIVDRRKDRATLRL